MCIQCFLKDDTAQPSAELKASLAEIDMSITRDGRFVTVTMPDTILRDLLLRAELGATMAQALA